MSPLDSTKFDASLHYSLCQNNVPIGVASSASSLTGLILLSVLRLFPLKLKNSGYALKQLQFSRSVSPRTLTKRSKWFVWRTLKPLPVKIESEHIYGNHYKCFWAKGPKLLVSRFKKLLFILDAPPALRWRALFAD